jgi:hypothetical protein
MERDWDNEDDEHIHNTGVIKPGTGKLRPRENPCKSCPYRQDVPSGVWSAEEYDKLPNYDGDTAYQDHTPFACHQADGYLCSGWVGHGDPHDLLALRLGVSIGMIHPSVFDYRTNVPLFASGAEAAEHGKRDIAAPDEDAYDMVEHLLKVRSRKEEKEH